MSSKTLSVVIREDQKEGFDNALSDVLCWMDGFLAAGGKYSPGSIDKLRDLRGSLSHAKEDNALRMLVESILVKNKNSIDFLIFRGRLKPGADLMAIESEYLEKVIANPANFLDAVKRWSRGGKK